MSVQQLFLMLYCKIGCNRNSSAGGMTEFYEAELLPVTNLIISE